MLDRLRLHGTLRRAARRGAACMHAVLLVCVLAAVSCSKEIVDEQTGRICIVPITLETGLEAQIDVKSVSGIDEKVIKDVWVIQLSEDGSKQLRTPEYLNQIKKVSGKYVCSCELEAVPSKVIFLANTGDASLVPSTGNTLASISALSYRVTADEASLLPNGAIPSSGEWNGTPEMTKGISIPLISVIAKVNLTLREDYSSGYKLKKVELINVPPVCYFFNCPRTATWPSESVGTPINRVLTRQTEYGDWRGSFFVPPVLNKTTLGTTDQNKTAAYAPSRFCQALRLTGTIAMQYPEIEGCDFNAECTHIFYLGRNTTNDWTIEPGQCLSLELEIKGANPNDLRCEVTKLTTNVTTLPLRWARKSFKSTSGTETDLAISWIYYGIASCNASSKFENEGVRLYKWGKPIIDKAKCIYVPALMVPKIRRDEVYTSDEYEISYNAVPWGFQKPPFDDPFTGLYSLKSEMHIGKTYGASTQNWDYKCFILTRYDKAMSSASKRQPNPKYTLRRRIRYILTDPDLQKWRGPDEEGEHWRLTNTDTFWGCPAVLYTRYVGATSSADALRIRTSTWDRFGQGMWGDETPPVENTAETYTYIDLRGY